MHKRERYVSRQPETCYVEVPLIPLEIVDEAETLQAKMNPVAGTLVQHQYTTVVDSSRKFVDVSESFCKLLGYRRQELIGRTYDEVTAPRTNDIPTVYCLFARSGYMHGVWVLLTRDGESVVVRYESWVRPDHRIQAVMELVA